MVAMDQVALGMEARAVKADQVAQLDAEVRAAPLMIHHRPEEAAVQAEAEQDLAPVEVAAVEVAADIGIDRVVDYQAEPVGLEARRERL